MQGVLVCALRASAVLIVALCLFAASALARPRLGGLQQVRATAYCSGQTTSSGGSARWGVIAAGYGTSFYERWLYVVHGLRNPLNGHRRWFFYAGDRDPSGPMDVFLEGVGEPLCGGAYPRTLVYRVAL